ncbi:MAG: hypothetical protein AAF288_06530 [Planctomycetota bacterium]
MLALSRVPSPLRLARLRATGLALATAAVLVASPRASAVEVPAQAVADNTALMVWADIASVQPQEVEESLGAVRQFLDTMKQGPMGQAMQDAPLLDPLQGAQKFAEFRNEFTAAGGQAFVLVGTPDEFGEMDEPVVLIKTNGAADPAALKAAMAKLADDPSDTDDVEFEALEPGWMIAKGDDTGELPAVGSPARANELLGLLQPQAGRPMAMVFVPTDQMRQEMNQGGQPGDPGAALGAAFSKARAMTGGLSLGANPSIKLDAAFPDAQSAQEFNTAYAGMMGQAQQGLSQMVQMFAGQQQPGMPPMPTADQVNTFFGSLALQNGGANQTLIINSGTLNSAGSMLPLFAMMMMGGGGGGF